MFQNILLKTHNRVTTSSEVGIHSHWREHEIMFDFSRTLNLICGNYSALFDLLEKDPVSI
jgi:hypothetical protein